MTLRSLLVALLLGVVQGLFEWLPISSEGNATLVLTALGYAPAAAVQFSLFLHLGTAVAAAVYYRDDLRAAAADLPGWRPRDAFGPDRAELTFLGAATLISGAVGVTAYAVLIDLATALAGGVFVALIGALLVATGLLQRAAIARVAGRERPGPIDAALVGIGQGLAILPGVSRSGTTVSLLLLRGHRGESALSLSFLLSIPAALGAGALAVIDAGGLPAVAPLPAAVALATAGVVGYLAIDVLMRLARRVAFWAVCVAIGSLALLGGALVAA